MFNISVNFKDTKKVDHILESTRLLIFYASHLLIIGNQRRYSIRLSICTVNKKDATRLFIKRLLFQQMQNTNFNLLYRYLTLIQKLSKDTICSSCILCIPIKSPLPPSKHSKYTYTLHIGHILYILCIMYNVCLKEVYI